MSPVRLAAIAPGCAGVPQGLVCGVPRRERLEKTLARKGFRVSEDPADVALADRVVPDCHVLCGDDEVHLCEVGMRAVETRLLNGLRKPIDGIVSKNLNRHISLFLTRRVMGFRKFLPNHVSIVTLTLALACGVMVAMGGYWFAVLGAVLLKVQSILDGVDGELARLRFQGSLRGQWLDTLSDDLSYVSFIAGVTLVTPYPFKWMGIVGLGAFVVTQAICYYALATVYHSGDLLAFQWETKQNQGGLLARLEPFVKRDFYCLFFLALALIGQLQIALVFAAAGSLSVLFTLLRQVSRHGVQRPVAAVAAQPVSAPALAAPAAPAVAPNLRRRADAEVSGSV